MYMPHKLVAILLVLAATAQARVTVSEQATPSARGSASPAASGSQVQASEHSAGVTAGYDSRQGGFYLRSEDDRFALVIGGGIQPRFTGAWQGDDEQLGEGEDRADFSVERARLYMLGHVFDQRFRYLLQVGTDEHISDSDFEVFDAWGKYVHSDAFAVKFGQFKLPFSRQKLTSWSRQQFVERSLAADTFSLLRDRGVQLSGGALENRFQWAFALSNGSGRNNANGDTELQYTGRVAFNPTGNYGYSEGDLEQRDQLASSLGLAFSYGRDESAPEREQELTLVNIDGGVKLRGFSLQGEWYWRRVDTTLLAEVDDVLLAGRADDSGVYLQGGYFVLPGRLELAGRWSRVFFDGEENDVSELSFGFGYFWFGHRLKLQADYSYLDLQGSEADTSRIRGQAQLVF